MRISTSRTHIVVNIDTSISDFMPRFGITIFSFFRVGKFDADLSTAAGGRAPLLGTLKDMPSKALEMGVCFYRAFNKISFLLGGLLLRNSRDMLEKAVEKGNSLHRASPLGNLEGVRFPGHFERQMEGTGKRASLIKLIWAPFLDPDC